MPRILIIEDNETSRYIFKIMLESQGYEVIQACDGYEGLQAAKQVKPDLILLDILLPGVNGYVIAQELKEDPQFSHIPILAVTALPMMSNRERALNAGCDDYVEKPINEQDLLGKIKAHLTAPKS